MNLKSCNPHFVAIEAFPFEEDKGVLKMTEETVERQQRKQNRGKVVLTGKDCDDWIQPGDTVSFYKNAATPVPVGDGEEVFLVHEDHILVKF